MKKILFIIALFFGVTFSAQDTKKAYDVETEAKKDTKYVIEKLSITGTKTDDILRLFEYKYRNLNENLSDERKTILLNSIEAKLMASFTPEEIQKLKSDQVSYRRLVSDNRK